MFGSSGGNNNNRNRTPCKFFQQGKCLKGSACKYAHVYTNANNNGNTNDNTDSKSAIELYRDFTNPQKIDRLQKAISFDLEEAKTIQLNPLSSSYSLAHPCGVNLIANRDLSPEESRWQYYQAKQKNMLQQYEIEMNARSNDIQKCFHNIKEHTDLAARYLQKNTRSLVETGVLAIPKDFITFPLDLTGQTYSNPQSMATPTNTSTFGSTNNAFSITSPGTFGSAPQGASPFASVPQGSSALGSATGGAFGKPAFGTTGVTNSAFGANPFMSNTNATSGTTAAVGSSAFGKPAFGATNTSSAFGNSAFGSSIAAPTSKTSGAFGKPGFSGTIGSGNAGTSTFGSTGFGSTPAAPVAASAGAFGSTGFGASLNQQGTGAFGSAGTNTASTAGGAFGKPAFGKPAFGSSAFGGTSASPFGSTGQTSTAANTSSPFGKVNQGMPGATTTMSPFGKIAGTPATTTTTASPFGSVNNNATQNTTSVFGTSQPATGQTTAFPVFGNAANKSSPFGLPNNTGNAPASNVFGFNTNSTSVPAGQGDAVTTSGNERFYQGLHSEVDKPNEVGDLSQETLDQFKALKFTLGKVPDMPPPVALVK
ncbi:FG-nucleoporin NUP42 NDAI_0B05500 [Naumovozyma dairenensis CBS 421]|uniref:C3H1-type domain-containing protein n=1 Tax=Naumovozyma dairenensis (strain ATCC 10597 / BCRC 20456 / CBS 421 / NBRC 0211 / NRRL Y-12639) TaxID=1071378 RepID=G0W722_NAUDC|nr:hypothetical protein NDAI_0B05500 [Naumovozyma dairenensis CBS 421]CCD23583.1 hypothetical protein NDAI_0B05500 [Naumovozyma dairenensis CBS 421]